MIFRTAAFSSWAVMLSVAPAFARASPPDTNPTSPAVAPVDRDALFLGPRIRGGGRYDNVRLCVASDAGVPGGPAADVSFFVEISLGDQLSIDIDLPVFRPILFALSFDMLQFEPSATVRYRLTATDSFDTILGAGLGLSLHYGPDYQSEDSGPQRGPDFFAMGPTLIGYYGLDFVRAERVFNFQIGLSAFVTPLFGIDAPENRFGIVVGSLLDLSLRFRTM